MNPFIISISNLLTVNTEISTRSGSVYSVPK